MGTTGAVIDPYDDQDVDLRRYLEILRHRKWSVVMVTLAVVASAAAVSFRMTPLYESRAKVLVQEPLTSRPGVAPQPPNLETERELATSDAVATKVARAVDIAPEDLLENLSVAVATNTEVLEFHYLDPDPMRAQELAQRFAEAYLAYRRERVVDDLLSASQSISERIDQLNAQIAALNEQIVDTQDQTEKTSLQSQVNSLIGQVAVLQQELADMTPPENLRVGQIVTPADLPTAPARPNHLRNLLLALVLGLALGVGVAFVRDRFDDRLGGVEELEATMGAPVLATVAKVPSWRRRDQTLLVSLNDPHSATAEAYRTLRTAVLFSAAQREAKTLMITSPHPGDGKTATACNLGVVLAQAGRSTIVVSADLRKPRVHRFFATDNHVGLTNVLAGEVSPWQALRPSGVDNLQLMLTGPVPGNPAELLGSEAMARLLAALKETVDFVLLDGTPTLGLSDAITLAPLADAVLFVIDPENSHRGAVEQSRRQLAKVDADVLGVVLNNFDISKARYGYYYGYGSYRYRYADYRYEEEPSPESPERAAQQLPWRFVKRR